MKRKKIKRKSKKDIREQEKLKEDSMEGTEVIRDDNIVGEKERGGLKDKVAGFFLKLKEWMRQKMCPESM